MHQMRDISQILMKNLQYANCTKFLIGRWVRAGILHFCMRTTLKVNISRDFYTSHPYKTESRVVSLFGILAKPIFNKMYPHFCRLFGMWIQSGVLLKNVFYTYSYFPPYIHTYWRYYFPRVCLWNEILEDFNLALFHVTLVKK